MGQSSPQNITGIKPPNQWPCWWKYHIRHKWPSKYWFRILRVKDALGSVVSAVPALSSARAFPPNWIGIPTTNPQSCQLGERCPHFILGGNTQIFCVFRTTILFLCLLKLHSEHSIIKTRPEFMNKWSIYYVGQRKDKLYAWKVSLSCDSHKPTCWQG